MAVGIILWGRHYDSASKSWETIPNTPQPLTELIRGMASEIGAAFDYAQWPPMSMAQGRNGPGCDGYAVFERRDFGSPDSPTRYGWDESWLAAIAALNAHGTQSLADLVLDALYGPNGGLGTFVYYGADGKTKNGAGGATPDCFMAPPGEKVPPFVANDQVAGGPSSIIQFGGLNFSYQHGKGTVAEAKSFLKYLAEHTGIVGCRVDAGKDMYSPAIAEIMESQPQLAYTVEYYDGNPANLYNYATRSPMNSRAAVEDFTFHYRVQSACNGFDATQFVNDGMGMWEWNAGLSVPYVETPDTQSEVGADGSIGEQVAFNKAIGYAVMLTVPCRMALVLATDYFPTSVWPGSYGLKPLIDNLCWCNRMFAFGNCDIRYVDKDVLALTRDGNGGALGWSGGMLTVVNFNTLSARTVTVETPFGPNRWLHDYTGHEPDIWTDGNGLATVTVRSNAYSDGQSYAIYAPGGVDTPFPVRKRTTTQTFTGDPTLRIMPARNGLQTLPQRIYCAKGSTINLHLTIDRTTNISKSAAVQVEAVSPSGATYPWSTTGDTETAIAESLVKETGWHTIRLVGSLLPDEGINFTLQATYTGV